MKKNTNNPQTALNLTLFNLVVIMGNFTKEKHACSGYELFCDLGVSHPKSFRDQDVLPLYLSPLAISPTYITSC